MKKIFSIILCMLIMVSILPTTVLNAYANEETLSTEIVPSLLEICVGDEVPISFGQYEPEYAEVWSSSEPDIVSVEKWEEYGNGAYVIGKLRGEAVITAATSDGTVKAKWLVTVNDLAGTCGDNLTWVVDSHTGVLTISGTGDMWDYVHPGDITHEPDEIPDYSKMSPWEYNQSNTSMITAIEIEDGVTSIGNYAFISFSKIKEISIPDSVKSIGHFAFMYCNALEKVTLPEGLESIGGGAFYGCDNLESINVPDSVRWIGYDAFTMTKCQKECRDEFYMGNHLIFAYGYGDGLVYEVKPGTKTIADGAFEALYGYESIFIPDSVINMGDMSVLSIDEETPLKSITVDENNQYYTSEDGVLFDKNKKTLLQYPYGKTDTSYVVPDGVTSIIEDSFRNCLNIESITIPKSVTTIEKWAFYSYLYGEVHSLKDVYYAGSEHGWSKISVGAYNDSLTNAEIHYTGIDIELNRSHQEMNIGEQTLIEARVFPEETIEQEILWVSSKPDVVQIENLGEGRAAIIARSIGETVITASIADGSASAECTVIVRGEVQKPESGKAPQSISVGGHTGKGYGNPTFRLEVVPDGVSRLDTFTYASSNEAVARIDSSGRVTIVGAGETEITVSQAGNDRYEAVHQTVKMKVDPALVEIEDFDLKNKTAVLSGILPEDEGEVELDFDSLITTVTQSGITTNEDGEKVYMIDYEVSNFKLKGEKSKNYTVNAGIFEIDGEESSVVQEDVAVDDNITVDAATIGDGTVIISDMVVNPSYEENDIRINLGEIETAESHTLAIAVGLFNDIADRTSETVLEIIFEDRNGNNGTISFDNQTLSAMKNKLDRDASYISFSLKNINVTGLEPEQTKTVEGFSTKSPVVYRFDASAGDESGTIADDFEGGTAKVEVYYDMPSNGKSVHALYLKNDGTTESVLLEYNPRTKMVKMILGHFSEYLIYTEPKVSSNSTGGGGISSYTVKFEANGGSVVNSQSVSKNKTITEPTAPTKEGYIFDGWYTDKELTAIYDFEAKVTKSFTLYAKWIDNKAETINPFADVNKNDWFYNAVMFAYENNITTGVSDTEFAPLDKVSRGQFVTMLCRAYGISEMTGDNFADCGDTYYTGYLSAAKQLGISSGIGDNKFAPEAEITREEMVTLLYNYLKSAANDDEMLTETVFADSDKISDWAKAAVSFASNKGYINGKGNNMFDPQGTATRAELAQIFYNIFSM